MSSRSYGHYCGLARALDVVGDRWTLLIVRELLVGPARYGELLAAIPGVATNLLADRLRTMEKAGAIERRVDLESNGIAYALTPWGSALREVVEALVRWSTPLMTSGQGGDAFHPRWLVVALRALLGARTTGRPTTVGIDVAGALLSVRVDANGPHVALDPVERPGTVLRADPGVVLGLAAGVLSVEQAVAAGTLQGDSRLLATVFGGGRDHV